MTQKNSLFPAKRFHTTSRTVAARKLQRGFTLIELLVVIAIIGILVVIGLGSFQSSQQRSRDARRKSDLRQIGNALEAYFNDKGTYPAAIGGQIEDGAYGSVFQDPVGGAVYMVEVPVDPRSSSYYYDSDGTYWQLYARLENTRDPAVPKSGSDDPQNYGVSCGTTACNYGVSSTNTSPEEGRTVTDD